MLAPTQARAGEVSVAIGSTLITVDLEQPFEVVYEIVVVPADTPVTTPVVATTVPTDGVELAHVPPAGELERLIVEFWHTADRPVIADGVSVTVTTRVV